MVFHLGSMHAPLKHHVFAELSANLGIRMDLSDAYRILSSTRESEDL